MKSLIGVDKAYDYGTNDYKRRQDNCHAKIDDQDDFDDGWRNKVIKKLKSIKRLVSRNQNFALFQLTTVLKSIRVVKITTIVTILSKIPRTPAIIVPDFKL